MDGYPVCAKCWNMHHDKSIHPAKDIRNWHGKPKHCSHCGEPTSCGHHMFAGRYCEICHITEPQAGPHHETGG